jgi:hypothetical protein
MQNRQMYADGFSKLLAVCAIGLFAAGHVLPVFIERQRTIEAIRGWEVVKGCGEVFYDWAIGVLRNSRFDPSECLGLFLSLFLPLFWLGVAGFFLTERSRPRIAGLVAVLSGLYGVSSMVVVWWLANEGRSLVASGYYLWLASMGLLFAAGVCKLIPLRRQSAT